MRSTKFCCVMFAVCLGLLVHTKASARQFFVATDGKVTNAGTFKEPWPLDTALRMPSTRVAAGDTINVRGGVYKGQFVSKLRGTASRPIIVRNFPGETPVLDAYAGRVSNVVTLSLEGGYVWFIGFEITNSSPSRISTAASINSVTDIHQATGVNVFGEGVKLINCEIHDCPGNGIGYWGSSLDAEVYGCFIYNNGITAADRGHGPNLYVQNQDVNRPKALRNSFVFAGFSTGIQFYGSANKLQGFVIDSNTIFNSGAIAAVNQQRRRNLLAGGETSGRTDATIDAPRVDGLYINGNVLYRDTTDNINPAYRPYADLRENSEFGYQDESLTDKYVSITGNHFYGDPLPITMHQFANGSFKRNFVFSYPSSSTGNPELIDMANTSRPFANWDSNTYYINKTSFNTPLDDKDFSTWKSTFGVDGSSSFTNGLPQRNEMYVRQNKYTPNRFYITVLNYRGEDSAWVSTEIGRFVGWNYEVFDVQQSLKAPMAKGIYQGGSIGMSLKETKAAATMGATPVLPRHTSYTLGTFVIAFYPQATTVKSGDWNDPSIWNGNQIPQAEHIITLQHPITISGVASCKTLNTNGKTVTVTAGTNLIITGK